MAVTGRITFGANVGGISMSASVSRSATGQIGQSGTFDAPDAGTLTTRTDNDTGVVTMTSGAHGLVTGDKVNVFWAAGSRHAMGCTVAGSAVTIDVGTGTNLPVESTAVQLCKIVELDTDWDGDLMEMLCMLAASSDMHIVLLDDAGAEALALDMLDGEPYIWFADGGVANPIVGDTIDDIYLSAAYLGAAGTYKIGVTYNSEL